MPWNRIDGCWRNSIAGDWVTRNLRLFLCDAEGGAEAISVRARPTRRRFAEVVGS